MDTGYLLTLLCCGLVGLVLTGQIAHEIRASTWFRERARRRRVPVAIARRRSPTVPTTAPTTTANAAVLGLGYAVVTGANPL